VISPQQFKADVWRWADEVGLHPTEVHLRRMTRKLASCSTRGRLTFDPALLGEPEDTRNEAIIHEILHLKYPNHGRMFRSLLKAYLGRGPIAASDVARWMPDR